MRTLVLLGVTCLNKGFDLIWFDLKLEVRLLPWKWSQVACSWLTQLVYRHTTQIIWNKYCKQKVTGLKTPPGRSQSVGYLKVWVGCWTNPASSQMGLKPRTARLRVCHTDHSFFSTDLSQFVLKLSLWRWELFNFNFLHTEMVSQSSSVVMVLTGFTYTGTGTNNGRGYESALICMAQ